MSRRINIAGKRFGRLVVIKHLEGDWGRVRCQCDCGRACISYRANLVDGQAESCGCLKRLATVRRNTTHGLSKTAEYFVWAGMKKRCYNPRFAQFADYGGRGIVMCDEWRDDFQAFLRDMGQRPSSIHTIERTDNNGPYSPANCCWLRRSEQAKNRRRIHSLTLNSETRSLADWTRLLGFRSHTVILKRLQRGWSVERALSK